jgi:hypothetical protein
MGTAGRVSAVVRRGRRRLPDFGRKQEEAMSAEKEQDRSEKDTTLQKRFRLIGVVILVAGLLAAALIDRSAAPADENSDAILSGNAKRYEYEMERMGGQSNVVAAEFREWFGSLWHGRRLAYTLAFLSIGGGLACFFIAHLLTYPPPPDNQTDGKDL